MPKSSRKIRTYRKRKPIKGGCNCNQKGGYSIKKLSIKKSIKKSIQSKRSRKPILMKGGLGGLSNSSLDFGTVGGATIAAGALGGLHTASNSNDIMTLETVGGNNRYSLPIV